MFHNLWNTFLCQNNSTCQWAFRAFCLSCTLALLLAVDNNSCFAVIHWEERRIPPALPCAPLCFPWSWSPIAQPSLLSSGWSSASHLILSSLVDSGLISKALCIPQRKLVLIFSPIINIPCGCLLLSGLCMILPFLFFCLPWFVLDFNCGSWQGEGRRLFWTFDLTFYFGKFQTYVKIERIV